MSDYAFFFLDAKKQNLFRNFREAIFRHEQMIPVQELSVDEINLVIKAVLTDTPEFFWFEGKWEYQRIGDMQYIHPIYTFDIAAFYEIQSQIDEICTNILMTVKDFTRDFDKIRYVYDWIIANVNYGLLNGSGQTIYDALVNRKAVCKGLSKGFQYLLKQMKFFSTLQEGTLDGASKHVWNIVEIHGKYLNVDVSMGYDCFSYLFDESQRNNKYRCLAVSDAHLSKFHRGHHLPWPSLNCDYDYPGGS